MRVRIPVGVGEYYDKLTILQIKVDKILAYSKRKHARHELEFLEVFDARIKNKVPVAIIEPLDKLVAELKSINEELWDIEDKLREMEAQHLYADYEHQAEFIDTARQVYKLNDKRSAVKRQINELAMSDIIEVKEHPQY